ncbi:serine/threonine protein kinase [Stigmatella aurantiaca]|uniref:Serine/threonine protein kinase n=2 Tax=Stigmatella aurantiaca TaxID=41 RepID=A0A1H7RK86_STIAU|nr:serine/threonine-protein kinase [Stigmatella aurantiaca]SEL60700.1 serine/threonine protein kinase [Stigmatella aurantiaca]
MTQQVGKYQLIRKLATGGMAEVYLAKAAGPRGFEKTLVVKCILPHLAQEPSFVEMFLSEAMLAAQLSHTHIVQIFDFGEADGAYFLAMEYIDGPSLRTLIKRAAAQNLPLDPLVCARLVSQACEGLAFAHDFVDPATEQPLALIHRDVSPDNLLLSRQGSVKVVDFGIAKATGQTHKTESGVIKGKLSYMPPEQLRAKNLDRRVDVYALGVVLYELLTFRKPYSAPSDVALMHAILYELPTPAVQHRPDLPVALQRILARAIAKDRDQRYPDCHSLQADLEDFILSGGRPVTGQQVAQLIQRATSGTGFPALNLAPGAIPSPVPLPARERTPVDTRSKTLPTPGRGAGLEGATFPEHTAATQDLSLTLPSPVTGRTEPRERSRARPRWGIPDWKWPALVGGVLLAAGLGLVRFQQDTPGTDTSSPPMASAGATPAAEPIIPPPPQPLTQAPPVAAPLPETPAPAAEPAPSEPQTSPLAAASPPARKRIARPAKTKRPAEGMGTLEVRSQPYAIVYVDGKEHGATPLDEDLQLPAGAYTMRLVIPALSKTVTQQIQIEPGKKTKINFSP